MAEAQAAPPPPRPDPLDRFITNPDFQKANASDQRAVAASADPDFAASDPMFQDYFLTARAARLGIDPYAFTDQRHGFPPGTMKAIQSVESGGLDPRTDITSPTGVKGLMQITGPTGDEAGMPQGKMRLDPMMQIAGAGNILASKVKKQGGNFLAGVASYGDPNQADYIQRFQRAMRGGPSWMESAGDTIRHGLQTTENAMDALTAPPGEGPGAVGRGAAALQLGVPAATALTGGAAAVAPLAGDIAETGARQLLGVGNRGADIANAVGQVGTTAAPILANTVAGAVTRAAPNLARRLLRSDYTPRALAAYEQLGSGRIGTGAAGAVVTPRTGPAFTRFLRPTTQETVGGLLGRARTPPPVARAALDPVNIMGHIVRLGTGYLAGKMMGGAERGLIGATAAEVLGPAARRAASAALDRALSNPLTAPLTRQLLAADPSGADYGRLAAVLVQRLGPNPAASGGQTPPGP